MEKTVKAYKVYCEKYFGNNVSYYQGPTASKVRYDALLDIWDSYPKATFADIQVLRAKVFDNLIDIDKTMEISGLVNSYAMNYGGGNAIK